MARHIREGEFVRWTDPSLRFDGTHPVIQASFGGHSTYGNSCGEHSRAVLDNFISDWVVCGDGRFAFRAASTPLVDLARTPWACWRGHFGVIPGGQGLTYVAGPLSPLRMFENAETSAGGLPCIPAGPARFERTRLR